VLDRTLDAALAVISRKRDTAITILQAQYRDNRQERVDERDERMR
jgi:hypothetical protein